MTPRSLMLLAAAGSAALLIAAFGFQYLGGLAPCKLCLWARWPHAAAVALGAVALIAPLRAVGWAGAAAAAATAGVGIYHTGVERGWWQGPTTCTASGLSGGDPGQLLDQIIAAPLVMCDQVAWEFLGLSMASWNAVISLALMALWIAAARAPTPTRA